MNLKLKKLESALEKNELDYFLNGSKSEYYLACPIFLILYVILKNLLPKKLLLLYKLYPKADENGYSML